MQELTALANDLMRRAKAAGVRIVARTTGSRTSATFPSGNSLGLVTVCVVPSSICTS